MKRASSRKFFSQSGYLWLLFSVFFPVAAFGQLAAGVQTFSGDVPASCSFSGLSPNYEMEYDSFSDHLGRFVRFSVESNSDARLGLSVETVIEPLGVMSFPRAQIHLSSGGDLLATSDSGLATELLSADPASKELDMYLGVFAADVAGVYVYRILVSCLSP